MGMLIKKSMARCTDKKKAAFDSDFFIEYIEY